MPTAHKYKRNRKHYIRWQRRYRAKKPTFSKKLRLLYGTERCLEEYQQFYVLQEGCCGICGKEGSDHARRLHLDHNHKTSKVRGLLCWSCNTKLGWTEKWMSQIVHYLRR